MSERALALNEEAISCLVSKLGENEEGMSSHWKDYLKDFEYTGDGFKSTGLPEGEGGSISLLGKIAHFILQQPYRRRGQEFSGFRPTMKVVEAIHKSRNTQLSLASLRQAIAISQVDQFTPLSSLDRNVLVIGDGYAVMSSIIAEGFSYNGKIILINLTQNLLIDAIYLRRFLPNKGLALVQDECAYLSALEDESIDFVLLRADDHRFISSSEIGLAINICSMQEMEIGVVRSYIADLRSSQGNTLFYCANRVHKVLPGGEVTMFEEYGWTDDDKFLFDEKPEWQQKYYSWRPPFYFPYDGDIRHALVELAK